MNAAENVMLAAAAAEGEGAAKPDAKGKGRSKGEPQKIDFLTPSEKSLKEMAEELFAPPGKGQSINLPGTAGNKRGAKRKKGANATKKDEHLLPDDMHFSSKQLVTLFLKPKFKVRPSLNCAPFCRPIVRIAQDAWQARPHECR